MPQDAEWDSSDWKVDGYVSLIPMGVTLRSERSGETVTVPTFYDPVGVKVYVPGDSPLKAEAIAAVMDYMKKPAPETIFSPVDKKTWDDIRMLSGLVKTPREI